MPDPGISRTALPTPDHMARLTKKFLGRVTIPSPSRVCTGTVQNGATGGAADVALDGMNGATFSCRYERRVKVNDDGTAAWQDPPPAGVRCVVVFPENESDYSPWIVTFVGYS